MTEDSPTNIINIDFFGNKARRWTQAFSEDAVRNAMSEATWPYHVAHAQIDDKNRPPQWDTKTICPPDQPFVFYPDRSCDPTRCDCAELGLPIKNEVGQAMPHCT